MEKIFYTRHDGGLTLFKKGQHSTVSSTHPNFAQILDALRSRKFELVETLMNIGASITKLGVSRKFPDRKIYVEGGKVFWVDSHKKARELAGPLVERILSAIGTSQSNKFADALLMFLDNIQKNEIKDIREELYQWLLSGKAPITYDGCFLAYKKVRSTFMDRHSNTMDNSPGKVVRIPRDQVDRDRANECSRGLHFCSRGYLSNFACGDGSRVVIVKVNPKNVFAIPRDYSYQKGRASEYFVVGEFKGNYETDEAFKDSFVDEDSKFASMPEVAFATGWLRPSLKSLGQSFGIIDANEKVWMAERRGIMIPVKIVTDPIKNTEKIVDILGTPVAVERENIVLRSFETKSVREAVKIAVSKADKTYKTT